MTQMILNQIERRAGLSFHANLMIGAMLAVLGVVAYAGTAASALLRTHIVLQGCEIVLMTLAAGIIANALHALSLAGTAAPARLGQDTIAA